MAGARASRWWWAVLLVVALPAAFAFYEVASTVIEGAAGRSEVTSFRGVRLGMTASDVRRRFDAPAPGEFRTVTDPELALEWQPRSARPLDSVRFEFHQGVLVAIRAVVPSDAEIASGDDLVVGTDAVLSRREVGPDRVELTYLARDCPTHRAEVRRLLASR